MAEEEFQILRLKSSYETFGIVVEFLARMEPFSRYDLGNFTGALQRQIHEGHHLAALTRDRMVGYCGWLPTTAKAGAAWQQGQGVLAPLRPLEIPDAVALTVVAAKNRLVVFSLLAEARKLNPYDRVYFKREYAGGARPARKRVVQNPG